MEIKDGKSKELEDQNPHTVDKLKKLNERVQDSKCQVKEVLVVKS